LRPGPLKGIEFQAMAKPVWIQNATLILRQLTPWFSAAAFLATFVLAAYFFLPAPPTPYSRYKISLVCTAVVLLVCATVFATKYILLKKNSQRQLADALTSRNEFADLVNSIKLRSDNEDAKVFSVLKDLYAVLRMDYEYCIFLRDNGSELGFKEIQARFDSYLSDFLNKVVSIFGIFTGHKCAACVKVLLSSKDKPNNGHFIKGLKEDYAFVSTISRDPSSAYDRNRAYPPDRLTYQIVENTGLFEVKHIPERNGYYAKNDLCNISPEFYRNSNGRWREFYDAVAVAALKNPSQDAFDQAIGYLCVDNLGGGFDDRVCRLILECLANLLYYSMQSTFPILILSQGRCHEQK